MAKLDPSSLDGAVAVLARRESCFAAIVDRHGSPPLWPREPDLRGLCHVVLEQKISLASAAAVMARVDGLVVSTGAGWSANRLLSIDRERFREAGTTYAKADCLHAIAREVAAGTLDFAALSAWPDAEVLRKLTTVRGIGPWTAGVFLTLALRRPDAWPPGDRALAVSYAETFGLARATSYRELDGFAEAWRPHRGAAARLLWHAYLARRKSVEE